MKRMSGFSVLLVAALAAGAVGCNNRLQKDFNDLSERALALENQNRQLQDELLGMQGRMQQGESELLGLRSDRQRYEAEMARLRAEAEQARRPQTKPADGWVETDRTARITVGSDVLFASGQATLSSTGKGKVGEIASTIKSRFPQGTVLVYGHTDTDPIQRTKNLWQDNLDLSANRAMAVTRELVTRGVSAKQIETVAMSQWHPVGSDKSRNRRVEIVVLK